MRNGVGMSGESEAIYQKILQRLRGLRLSAGLTLRQVEIRSRGRWKAVVIGSYERGARHLSLKRAIELCDFYGADISALGTTSRIQTEFKVIIDLPKLATARQLPDDFSRTLSSYANFILAQRGDVNGQVLSIRKLDLECIEIMNRMNREEVLRALQQRQLLIK